MVHSLRRKNKCKQFAGWILIILSRVKVQSINDVSLPTRDSKLLRGNAIRLVTVYVFDCTFTLLKISSIQPANCLHLFLFLRSAPLIEIIKWIKIYRTTHILTSLNNIFYYLMRRMQSITINFPFNKIISTLWIL